MWHRTATRSVAAAVAALMLSAWHVRAEVCGGFGHPHNGVCHCDDGYTSINDPADCVPTAVPAPNSMGSWTAVVTGGGETPEQHIWHLLGKDENDVLTVDDMQKVMDAVSGLSMLAVADEEDHDHEEEEEAEAEDHGHLEEEEGEDHDHDEEDVVDNAESLMESVPTRRLQQEICAGVGHPHNGECHCNDGYFTDPQDPTNCLPESVQGSAPAATWNLYAADIAAYAGENGALHMEDLSLALPLIASCQMDPSCSLDVSPKAAVIASSDESEGQVELWMALVAAVCFFLIPLIGMGIPVIAAKLISINNVNVLISLGNCLSAGIIFSLGIMHIIPASVEAMYSTGVSYPLNYLLIVVGFFFTLILEDSVPNHGALGMEETLAAPEAGPGTPTNKVMASGHHTSDLDKSASTMITVHKDDEFSNLPIEYAQPESKKPQRGGFIAALLSLLPLLVFFVAIQFHACIEAVLVGIQTDPENFWILFAGIGLHKLFVSFALGVKLQASLLMNEANKWNIVAMASLWALLPALCVIIGYLASATIDPMAALVLTSLSGGIFIYIGSYELLSEEFKMPETPENVESGKWGSKTHHKYIKYAFVTTGLVLVAALSAIPHKHD